MRPFVALVCSLRRVSAASRSPPAPVLLIVVQHRLRQAIATMTRHLCPGDVLFVDQPDLTLVRMNVSGVDRIVAILDFHCLVGTPDGVEHFTERHELGLFTDVEYRAAFTEAGLEVLHDAEGLIGRGLYIGTRARVRNEITYPAFVCLPGTTWPFVRPGDGISRSEVASYYGDRIGQELDLRLERRKPPSLRQASQPTRTRRSWPY
jgi:hypothetical protein